MIACTGFEGNNFTDPFIQEFTTAMEDFRNDMNMGISETYEAALNILREKIKVLEATNN